MLDETRHGIGGNAPPLAERLEIDYASLQQQVADVLALSALDPIFVDDDLEAYSERAKALKDIGAMVEKARKGEKDQINKDGRTVEAFFATLAKPIKDAADSVVASINAWQRKKLQEENERLRREAEVAKIAATPFDEAKREAAPQPQVAARVVSSATGKVTAAATRFWNYRIIDPAAVPRAYCAVDEGKIKSAIQTAKAMGQPLEIPGVEIFEDVRTAIR